jgi:hypothetical protein
VFGLNRQPQNHQEQLQQNPEQPQQKWEQMQIRNFRFHDQGATKDKCFLKTAAFSVVSTSSTVEQLVDSWKETFIFGFK